MEIISFFALFELFPGSCSQAVWRVFLQLGPVGVDYFVGWVVELAALGRVGVQSAGRQAAFGRSEAVRVQANDVHLFGYLFVC